MPLWYLDFMVSCFNEMMASTFLRWTMNTFHPMNIWTNWNLSKCLRHQHFETPTFQEKHSLKMDASITRPKFEAFNFKASHFLNTYNFNFWKLTFLKKILLPFTNVSISEHIIIFENLNGFFLLLWIIWLISDSIHRLIIGLISIHH